MLTVIDEFTRRCMAVVVERRLNSDNVLHCLTELFVQHGGIVKVNWLEPGSKVS